MDASHSTKSKGMPTAAAKYQPYPQVDLSDRTWPGKRIEKAPIWCSVDLRDGNQALVDPMGHDRKARMFQLLLDMGFKEIEIGFPSASQTDFDFARWCVENGNVGEDVSLQVLVQCRPELITRTFEALEGAHRPIVHFYNSTSELQRRVVFGKDVAGIKQIAVDAAKMITDMAAKAGGGYRFEYSPESFTGTELEVALEVCNAVIAEVKPTPDNKLIINLPSTVEMSMPNIYADQIEWMCRNLDNRENLLISVHPHNDRGTGIASAEMGLLAGADRVEGTLFGNGERTGNVDIVTLGLNMFTQGVDPTLTFSDINELVEAAEFCNQLPVHERHPYAGKLVHTAFSGSHQDAIRKGMDAIRDANSDVWEVPYLPIDPGDIGRTFEAIIRVNSQSGKAGSAYLLEADHHVRLPRGAEIEFSGIVQDEADKTGKEITSQRIWELAEEHFIRQTGRFELLSFDVSKATADGSADFALFLHHRTEPRKRSPLSGIQHDSPTPPALGINQFRPALSRHIPQSVKDMVWQRDRGMCQANWRIDPSFDKFTGETCGSNLNLEFDHIVPYSKGGRSTYRNLQLLCDSCNLKKGNTIGG